MKELIESNIMTEEQKAFEEVIYGMSILSYGNGAIQFDGIEPIKEIWRRGILFGKKKENEETKTLQAKVEIYEKAVEYYADSENWKWKDGKQCTQKNVMCDDCGDTARYALEQGRNVG